MWEQLGKIFHISAALRGPAVTSLDGDALLDRDAMRSFLAAYRRLIDGMDDTVPAAYFASWFGSVAAALHYAMSVHHAAPDFSTGNLRVYLISESGYTQVAFQVIREKTDTAPDDPDGRPAETFRRASDIMQ